MTRLWVCLVRHEAFVGGESQRCRHSETCLVCEGIGKVGNVPCRECGATGQYWPNGCGVMELIGGEPVEWCRIHSAERAITKCFRAVGRNLDPCQFETQIRVGG